MLVLVGTVYVYECVPVGLWYGAVWCGAVRCGAMWCGAVACEMQVSVTMTYKPAYPLELIKMIVKE